MEKSIYQQICDHLTEGILADDFSVKEEDHQEGAFRFAPGALDGITCYHMGLSDPGEAAAKEMIRALKCAARGSWEEADHKFAALCKDHRALCLVDYLQNYLRGHVRELDPGEMHAAAVHFLLHSGNIECVKIGLGILELFGEPVDELKEIIRRLGQYDEFTLFAVWNMQRWKNANEEIYRLARLTRGWGRIHAVERMEPETEEIRRWLLTEGSVNEVMSAYSALTCWTKSGAGELLSGNITQEEYQAIAGIMEGLLDEGPVQGLSGIADREQVLLRFLEQSKIYAASLHDFERILNIFAWTEDQEEDYLSVRRDCDTLLHSKKCILAVSAAVEKGEGLRMADLLEIPFRDQLLGCMREDFEHFCYQCGYLLEDPAYVELTLDLFREKLPLSETGNGPEDTMETDSRCADFNALEFLLQELADMPLTGTDLILAGIRSSNPRLRYRALAAAQGWAESAGKPLEQLSPELFEAVKDLETRETAEEMKEMIAPLLSGEIHFRDAEDSEEREENEDE